MKEPARVVPGAVLAGGPVVFNGRPPRGRRELSPHEQELQREAHQRGLAEGLEAGRERGLAEGRRAADEELHSAAQALSAALEQLGDGRRRLLGELQRGALALALAVARKIVHAELDGRAEAAARVVQAAIDHAKDAAIVRVRVHPGDKERLEQLQPGALPRELLADPSISPGGCIVETDCGLIDATLDTRWEQVAGALADAAHEGRADVEVGSGCQAGPAELSETEAESGTA